MAMTGSLCGLTPFLFRRKAYGIEVQLDMVSQFCSACPFSSSYESIVLFFIVIYVPYLFMHLDMSSLGF